MFLVLLSLQAQISHDILNAKANDFFMENGNEICIWDKLTSRIAESLKICSTAQYRYSNPCTGLNRPQWF
jgi:hypothetical protein